MANETAKHTPGPWSIGELSPGKPYVFVDEERTIALLYDKRTSFPQASISDNQYLYEGQAEANARLIAAAPDLLEALEGMKRIHGNCGASPLEQEICAKMDAAIAAARGED